MRICFSMNPREGIPAGGGMKFAIGLKKFLNERGHQVEFESDINNPPDLYFIFDPRFLNYSRNWLTIDHVRYLQDVLKIKTPIVHRLNDIGAPKERPANYVIQMKELANRATAAVHVSEFVKEYYGEEIETPSYVIHNGVDRELFTIRDYEFDKIKLVTHHWSNNHLKGWDIYQQIDEWLGDRDDIELNFIGNVAKNIPLKNIKVHSPTHGTDMVNLLKQSNIYLTASRYEPCGNHYIEGVACGLPLLYHTDGGGVLSMKDFGLGYKDFDDFKNKLSEMCERHMEFYDKIVSDFNFYHDVIFEQYYDVIKAAADKTK